MEESAGTPRGTYRFGRFTLDAARGALLDGGGAELPLRPKSFALLYYLVERAGRAVARDELMAAVWPGLHVSDDSVAQCVGDIRRVLGGEGQLLLRTLPRRGYLFAPPVSRAAAVLRAAEGAVPPPPAGRPMVAVLPFGTVGGEAGQGYFADGLTGDLVTDLTRFQVLHVIAPPRSLAFRDGSGLGGAAYLVGGGVRREGGRVRVTAYLDDARTGVRLWAERFDRPLGGLFAVQEELAAGIAASLVAQVDQEGLRQARRRPPEDLTAYELCLRGRELHDRQTEADTLAARGLFARAIDADPFYADAHAYQAFTVQRGFTQGWGEPRGRAALPPALEFARRAAELEPDSPRCAAVLGYVLFLCGRWDDALDASLRAVRLNPGAWYGRASYGEVLAHAGDDPEAAVQQTRHALALDPFHPPRLRHQLGRALLLAGRPEEALAELRPLATRLPDYSVCHHTVVTAAVEAGCPDEARASARELARLGPNPALGAAARHFRRAADAERFRAAHRAMGLNLPEG